MRDELETFQQEFNHTVSEAQRFCFAARGREFQEQALSQLEALRKKAGDVKQNYVRSKNEDSANALLSYEAIISALVSELRMWIALKDDNPNSAWSHLVNAQEAAHESAQAHALASLFSGYTQRLSVMERILFPPQIFVSTGEVVEEIECSICGRSYGECDHIAGRPYLGEICYQKITKIKRFDHLAIVEEPASKHHRTTAMTDGDVSRDVMSWKVVPDIGPRERGK